MFASNPFEAHSRSARHSFSNGGHEITQCEAGVNADAHAALRVEFELRTGWVRNLGGWNLDDFEIYALDSTTGQCPDTTAY